MGFETMLLAAVGGAGGGFGLHNQLLVGSTVIVVVILIVLALIGRSQLGVVPRGWGAAFEHVFDWLDTMARDMIGSKGRQYVPFLMSLFLFILFSNWSGLIPLPVATVSPDSPLVAGEVHDVAASIPQALEQEETGHSVQEEQVHLFHFESPTASYNTTLALALISFFAFNWYGIKKNVFPNWGPAVPPLAVEPEDGAEDGHGHSVHPKAPGGPMGFFVWLAHFIQPTPMLWKSLDGPLRYLLVPLLGVLFLGLNIVEELARILSLSIRLFGNVSGEHAVTANLKVVLYQFLGQSLGALKQGGLVAGTGWLFMGGLIWGASVFAILLGTLAGFIQAMIFSVLSLVYIAHAVADDH